MSKKDLSDDLIAWINDRLDSGLPLFSGSLPIYGLDGNTNAAGAMVQAGEQIRLITTLLLLPAAFTPLGPVVNLAFAAEHYARGDKVGAAIILLGDFLFKVMNSISARIENSIAELQQYVSYLQKKLVNVKSLK